MTGKLDASGLHKVNGKLYAARLKNTFSQSAFFVIDRDEVDGMPKELIYKDHANWWNNMCNFLPMLNGVSYLLSPSNSGRIIVDGEPFAKDNSHVFLHAQDAEDIERFGKSAFIHSVGCRYGFMKELRSNGKITGHRRGTIFDSTTFSRERELFDGAPTIIGNGLEVQAPNVRLIKGKNNTVNTKELLNPSLHQEKLVGIKLTRTNSGNLKVHNQSDLTLETIIDFQKQGKMNLGNFITVANGQRERCQSPFRPDSTSMAAFVNFTEDGTPFLHDVGDSTTYYLKKTAAELFANIPLNDGNAAPAIVKGEFLPSLETQISDLTTKPEAITNVLAQMVSMDDQIHVELLLGKIKTKTGLGIKPLRQQLENLKPKALAMTSSQSLEEFNKTHGGVRFEGVFKIAYLYNDSVLGGTKLAMMSTKHAQEYYSNRTIQGSNIVDVWMASKNRRSYDSVVFKPIAGLVANTKQLPAPVNGALNLYQGLAVEPQPGDHQLIIKHIWEVWCNFNKELYWYVMNWMARMFQQPDCPGETVIAIKSSEGAGKNAIVDTLMMALGSHSFSATKPKQILGDYNDHIATSILVFLNECLWGGDKGAEGTLKSLITDSTLPCHKKFMPMMTVRNCTHIILASNNEWFAAIGLEDRRFVVLDVSDARIGDVEYFNALNKEINNGGAESFIDYLLKLDISNFNHRELPSSQGASRLDNKMLSADTVTQWWYECLIEGEIFHFEDSLARLGSQKWDNSDITLLTNELNNSYTQWCAQQKKRHIDNSSVMVRKMKKLCPEMIAVRPAHNGNRRRSKLIPQLGIARELFAKFIKEDIGWN